MDFKNLDEIIDKGPLNEVDKKLLIAFSEMIATQAKRVLDIKNYEEIPTAFDDDTLSDAFQVRIDSGEFEGSQLLED